MPLARLWDFISSEVFPHPSTPTLFNPYGRENPLLDLPGAPALRRSNLWNYFQSLPGTPRILLVGEAPGPRGCRFSGVPFTSESLLVGNRLPFHGIQTSRRAIPFSEASSTMFWRTLLPYHPDFIVWNAIPFHPHRPDDALSLRTPLSSELQSLAHILNQFILILEPETVIAIGRKAEEALNKAGVASMYIRHPSHGGAREFSEGIKSLFSFVKSL